uniref:Uncharacterized protein n=1 Tax=Hyaloperonospora arabidopsidis (strain Emoy2) TaxID=559515 RepID=M4BCF7_HYAAE
MYCEIDPVLAVQIRIFREPTKQTCEQVRLSSSLEDEEGLNHGHIIGACGFGFGRSPSSRESCSKIRR